MPNWKRLDRRSRPVATIPVVGIQKKGVLSLNAAARDALGGPEAVEVLYDDEERLIGLRASDLSAGTYPLRKQGPSQTWLVAAMSLAPLLKMDVSRARRYNVRMDDGTLVIDLKQEGFEASRGSRGT